MNYKRLVLTLFLVLCLIGAVNASKDIDDFVVPSDYYPLTDTFPYAHEGTYSHNDNNSGLVIMKFGEEDEDINGYLVSDGNITYTKNDDNTYYFADKTSYSHGIYEVFEVDGEKFFANFWFSNSNDISDDEIEDIVSKFNKDNDVNLVSFSVPSSSSSMSILKATVSTPSIGEKTKCTVFLGTEHSGESVKISVLYSCDGENLNKGIKVDNEVSNTGEITVYSKDSFDEYPDKAIITIYDSNKNKLDEKTVTLNQGSEPQDFKFSGYPKPRNGDPKYASNGAEFVGYAGDGGWANYIKDGHYYDVDGVQID